MKKETKRKIGLAFVWREGFYFGYGWNVGFLRGDNTCALSIHPVSACPT